MATFFTTVFTAIVVDESGQKKVEKAYEKSKVLARQKLIDSGFRVLEMNDGTPIQHVDCVGELETLGFGVSAYVEEFLMLVFYNQFSPRNCGCY